MDDKSMSPRAGSTTFTYRPLVRVKGSHSIAIVPLGNVHTWLMHWFAMDKRTQPCVLDRCQGCKEYLPRRPLSYVAIAHLVVRDDGPAWSPGILEVPLSTGCEVNERRGQAVCLRRMRPRGPIQVGTFSTQIGQPTFGKFDIVPSLLRLWRLTPDLQLRLLDPSEWTMWAVAHD